MDLLALLTISGMAKESGPRPKAADEAPLRGPRVGGRLELPSPDNPGPLKEEDASLATLMSGSGFIVAEDEAFDPD